MSGAAFVGSRTTAPDIGYPTIAGVCPQVVRFEFLNATSARKCVKHLTLQDPSPNSISQLSQVEMRCFVCRLSAFVAVRANKIVQTDAAMRRLVFDKIYDVFAEVGQNSHDVRRVFRHSIARYKSAIAECWGAERKNLRFFVSGL